MKKTNNKTSIILSVIALAMIIVLAAGITFSWVEGGDKGYVESPEVVISTGSSLTMRCNGQTTNEITIPSANLYETSSADGRNFFFPLADNSTNIQGDMTFREGTPADENTKYLSLDFELEAGNSGSPVYFGAGTMVRCDNENVMNALRMCFNFNDGTTTKVFKPNQMPGTDVTMSYSPITEIDTDGNVTATGKTETYAYGNYYFKGETDSSNYLFTIQSGETMNITLTLWLEGTEIDTAFTAEDLGVYIEFTTLNDDVVKYNFVDNTHNYSTCLSENWVSLKEEENNTEYETMMYIYDLDNDRYYAMNKATDGTSSWSAYISRNITNFSFRRYTLALDRAWNEWLPKMDEIPLSSNNEHTYVAICGKADYNTESNWLENVGPCGGYWKNSTGTFRVYFQNEAGWTAPYCYAWDANDDYVDESYPGILMTLSHKNNNYDVYYCDLNESDNIVGIQFNSEGISGRSTIYCEDQYNIYAYDSNQNPLLGDWNSAPQMGWDSHRQMFSYTIYGTGKFYVILKSDSGQYPGANQQGIECEFGKNYKIAWDEGSSAQRYQHDVTNTDYFFSGFTTWYSSTDSNGVYLYTGKENSLIFY